MGYLISNPAVQYMKYFIYHFKIQPVNNEEEFVICKSCEMTTPVSVFQTKLVSQMMIKTDQNKLENFTCFNDVIQSFFYSKTLSNTLSQN